MAKWQDGVITNAGISLLGEVIAGGEINITRAALGGGTVDEAALMAQTALTLPLTISPVIAAKKLVEGKGIEIRIQIRNDGLAEDKVMKQVGLFAQLNSGDEVLFAIMQNDTGEEIPSEASYPDFMLEYTAALAVSNTGSITVSVSGSAVITQEALDDALKSKADKTYVDEALKGKSDTNHTHDNRYYTESETDALLNGKAASNHTHSNVTTSAAGFMSSSDKSKLDGISESADSVSVSPALTSGTKVGTITINGTAYDLYCQTNTDTKYSAGTGISISGTKISNSGVLSIASGGSNGTISVNTNGTSANVAVKGLASAAYQALQTVAGTVGLHRISSGTADATTTNCPAGCWYGKHS